MAREQLKSLTEPMYYVLLSLIKENHGYGIMQMINEFTEGRVTVGAGTLYALLARFEKEQIIEQTAERDRRKLYQLTAKGQGLLQEEFERLNKMVSDGQKFMSFDGDIKNPPSDNTGSGITMPIEETESSLDNLSEKDGVDTETPAHKNEKRKNKEEQEDKKLSFGGLGKGLLLPT
ncbi:MAG: PadR family transcriptional regulator [Aminipila sp.]